MSPQVKELLYELRESFNAKYTLRVKQGAKIAPEEWLAHVEQIIIPLVERTLDVCPERARLVFTELYDVSLELFSVGHFGLEQRAHPLVTLWKQAFPRFISLIAREPRRISGSLSNAVLSIAQSAPSTLQDWVQRMTECGDLASTTEQLLDLGKVAAWRSGLAQYRSAALTLAQKLPDPMLQRLFEVPQRENIETIKLWLQSLQKNPWLPCCQSLTVKGCIAEVARYGSFQGFGGVFKHPPKRLWPISSFLFGTNKPFGKSTPTSSAAVSNVRIEVTMRRGTQNVS